MIPLVAFLDGFGPVTIMLLGAIAVMLFGERLPEVAKGFGKQLVDFKKSVQGMKDQLHSAAFSETDLGSTSSYSAPNRIDRTDDVDRDAPTAPKFVPPKSEPVVEPEA